MEAGSCHFVPELFTATLQGDCMSLRESKEDQLRQEIVELREEVRRLTLRVDRQSDQLALVTSRLESSERAPATEEEAVEENPRAIARAEAEERLSEARGSYTLVAPSVVSVGQAVDREAYTWEFRQEIARGIGLFLQRSLRGEFRGSSGRDRLRGLASHYYLVVRDIRGEVSTHPIRVFTSFPPVRRLCARGSGWGDSIFIGVPTIEEGRIAVEAAGFDWPPKLNQ